MKTYKCKICSTEWTVEDNEVVKFCPVCYTKVGIDESINEVNTKAIFRQVQGLLENNRFKEAVALLQRAITRGDAYAEYMLGECYNSGWGVDKDKDKAIELFTQSAEQGYVKAQYELAMSYCRSFTNDIEVLHSAEYWFDKALKQGFKCEKEQAIVKKKLADLYEFGVSTAMDEVRALELYEEACDLDITSLGYEVPLCYFYGIGVEKNYKMASIIFDTFANNGNILSKKYLAICYQNGLGVERDIEKAMSLYKEVYEDELKLIETSYDENNEESVANHDENLFNQVSMQLSKYNDLEKWLIKASEKGDLYGECELGWYYFHKAIWYTKKVDYSSKVVANEKAKLLQTDKLQQYYDTAFKLFESSSNKEFRNAMYLLAYCYEYGLGTKKNLKLAKKCYKNAITPEDTFAKKILKKPKFWFR